MGYEEKSMMKFVQDRLTSSLKGLKFEIPGANAGSIQATAVTDVEGTATISISRGKRRHLFDVKFDVEYVAKIGELSGKGKLCFSEVSAQEGEEYEVKNKVDAVTNPQIREVLESFVKPAGQGLQPLIAAEIQKFIAEYKQT